MFVPTECSPFAVIGVSSIPIHFILLQVLGVIHGPSIIHPADICALSPIVYPYFHPFLTLLPVSMYWLLGLRLNLRSEILVAEGLLLLLVHPSFNSDSGPRSLCPTEFENCLHTHGLYPRTQPTIKWRLLRRGGRSLSFPSPSIFRTACQFCTLYIVSCIDFSCSHPVKLVNISSEPQPTRDWDRVMKQNTRRSCFEPSISRWERWGRCELFQAAHL